MDLKGAKELLHIQAWLVRTEEIVRRGKDAYATSPTRFFRKLETRS
ncbi:MAG: hypothetical protein M3306_15995 [Actinomycetota bacterium]|nr:hypothetical protein [Actinomycetota bacterium]